MPQSSSSPRPAAPPPTVHQHDVLTKAIARVLTPVMICMILAVWFVNGHGDSSQCVQNNSRRYDKIYSQPLSTNSQASQIVPIVFMVVFFSLVILFTFLIVWLYKTGRQKIISAWLITAVFVIFGYIGGLYIFDFCRSHCINLDWITLVLAVWNFTVTGLFAVFSSVPRLINQAYLIVMSALMAFIFRPLPSWSIWAVLAGLVLWDLYAVLGPGGPLKVLVALARERGEDLPALVYDTNPHAAGRDYPTATSSPPKPIGPADLALAEEQLRAPKQSEQQPQASQLDVLTPAEVSDTPQASKPAYRRKYKIDKKRKPKNNSATQSDQQSSAKGQTPTEAEQPAAEETLPSAQPVQEPKQQIPVGTLGTHLKLGLGDFVFYSILVAEASKTGAMTAIISFIAILAGLCATLFLVTVCRKALPALPISITAGLLFYLLTRYTLQPFTANLFDELLFH